MFVTPESSRVLSNKQIWCLYVCSINVCVQDNLFILFCYIRFQILHLPFFYLPFSITTEQRGPYEKSLYF